MKVCFDTSVVVPALVQTHPSHTRALVWVEAASGKKMEGMIAWHGLAETWSVLTRLPLVPAVTARAAEKLLERLISRLKPLNMSPPVYREAIRRSTERGVRSGALFDALHLVAAERAGADVFLTLNPGDFERLATPGGLRIVVPPDPPRVG
jgi:predicted nucleic acid-binding protein